MSARLVVSLALVIWAAASCGRKAAEDDTEVHLRVATSHGLGAFTPGRERSGGAALYVRDLAFVPVTDYADIDRVEGDEVFLRPHSARSEQVLAEKLTYYRLDETLTRSGGMVVARFESPEAAAAAARAFRNDQPAVAQGPFYAASKGPTELELRSRRSEAAIDVIEVKSLPGSELWRRLLGRDVDLIPVMDARHREQFEGMETIRVRDLPAAGYESLVFNTRRPYVSDARVRARLAGLLNTEAIARVACGTAACRASSWAKPAPPDPATGSEPALPSTLNLAVLDTDSTLVLAADLIRYQLQGEGIEVEIDELPLDSLLSPSLTYYDGWLVPLPATPSDAIKALSGYGVLPDDEEMVSATRGIDDSPDAAAQALAEQIPALPLYETRYFAAIDARFCGESPERATSWEWLADLYLCEDET